MDIQAKGLDYRALNEAIRAAGPSCRITGCLMNDFTQNEAIKLVQKLNAEEKRHSWIPVEERLPEEDEYVLMSFENLSLPIIGRYEKDNDGGGAWYAGDDGCDTCSSQDLFVNAWMPLPKPYRANMEEKPDVSTDWKGHYMGRFEKVE